MGAARERVRRVAGMDQEDRMSKDKDGLARLGMLFLLACMVGCAQSDPEDEGESAAEADTEEAAPEMGCPGFDPKAVPVTYLDMKPCLEQLRWELEWTAKGALEIRDHRIHGRHDRTTTLKASGTQLYWTWEEDGSRAGHYAFTGSGNTIEEMVLQRRGTATHSGTGMLESDDGRIDSKTELQGPADGTRLAGIGRDGNGRTCVSMDFGASMRGTSVDHVPGRGEEEASPGGPGSSRPSWIGRKVQEDPWDFEDEAASQVVCTGAAKDDYERLQAWHGLRVDDQAGTWTFQGTQDWSPPTHPGSSVWHLTLRIRKERRTVAAPRARD